MAVAAVHAVESEGETVRAWLKKPSATDSFSFRATRRGSACAANAVCAMTVTNLTCRWLRCVSLRGCGSHSSCQTVMVVPASTTTRHWILRLTEWCRVHGSEKIRWRVELRPESWISFIVSSSSSDASKGARGNASLGEVASLRGSKPRWW